MLALLCFLNGHTGSNSTRVQAAVREERRRLSEGAVRKASRRSSVDPSIPTPPMRGVAPANRPANQGGALNIEEEQLRAGSDGLIKQLKSKISPIVEDRVRKAMTNFFASNNAPYGNNGDKYSAYFTGLKFKIKTAGDWPNVPNLPAWSLAWSHAWF